MSEGCGPLRVAIVNDYEVVVAGLATMLAPYADRVRVVELDAAAPVVADVDIALYDTFAQGGDGAIACDRILGAGAHKLVAYSWDAVERETGSNDDRGVSAYLTKRMPGAALVEALERIHAGTWAGPCRAEDVREETGDGAGAGDWPGREHGLSEREAEVVALIVQGLSNLDVADRAYLSINTVKSHIRTAYKKMGVSSRSQAILWALDHGFERGPVRIRTMADEL